jgi:hypothetical protein
MFGCLTHFNLGVPLRVGLSASMPIGWAKISLSENLYFTFQSIPQPHGISRYYPSRSPRNLYCFFEHFPTLFFCGNGYEKEF